jgi:MFS family permease
MTQPAMSSGLGLLRQRNYALFLSMRISAVLAMQMTSTALGWQVYDIARDQGMAVAEAAFLLGVVGLVQFLPLLALSLLGGQLADRWPRKRIIMACLVVELAITVMLFAALPIGQATGMGVLAVLFAAAAGFGTVRAFMPPAQAALGPTLVAPADLPRAIALNSLGFTTASIAGPALGGLLYAGGGNAVYAASAALFMLSLLLAVLIRAPAQPAIADRRTGAMILEGLRYVRSNRVVLGAITLDLAVVLFAGAVALMPVFARDILKVGPEGLGLLRAAPAAGAAIVAALLAWRPLTRRLGRWMFAAVAVFGVVTIAFGLSTSFALSLALLVVLGAADMISVYVRGSLIQIAAPDAMRGRVAAVSGLCISASNELGEFQSGVAARFLGPILAVVSGGVIALFVVALWMRLFPELARVDTLTAVAAEDPPPASPARPASAPGE